MRLKRVMIAAALFCMALGAGIASARDVQKGDECVVSADQTITGNLLVLCRVLTVNGHVEGNLIGAATSAVINGTIDGDVYLVAGELDVQGTIGEDLHFAGLVLRVHEQTELTSENADLMTFSLSTQLMDGATIPGSVIGLGYQVVVAGEVGGELSFWGSSLTISGQIGGDVNADVGDSEADVSQLQTLLIPLPLDITLLPPGLHVVEGARIRGILEYAGPSEGDIAAGTLANPAVFNPIVVQPDFSQIALGEEDQSRGIGVYLSQVVREFIALGVIGLLGLALLPRSFQAPLRSLQARPLACLGVGLLAFIVSFPIFLILFILSVLIMFVLLLLQVNELTIIVGFVLGIMDVGTASVFYFVAIFVARVVVALAVGRGIVRMVLHEESSPRRNIVGLAVGIVLLAIIASLPILGWIVNALALFLGLGAILTFVQAQAETARESTPAPRVIAVTSPPMPRRADEPRLVPPPPPMLEDRSRAVGADNLPAGFTWWDD